MSKYYEFVGKMKSKSTSRYVGIDSRHPYHHLKSSFVLQKFIDRFKENIPILASLILILGGGTQLIILFNLDPSLIRFFSGNQMLVDGLILLTALLSIYFLGRSVYYVEANYQLNTYMGIFIFFAIFTFYRPDFDHLFKSPQFYWVIVAMIYYAILMIRHDIRFPIYGIWKMTKKGMLVLNIFLYLSGILFFGGVGYFWFDKIYDIYNVEEISNYSNIECYLNKEPYLIKDYKVLYYNDSYIFIDIKVQEEYKVKVFPIDILLNSTPCKTESIDYFHRY